jgi:threonine dehydrogenase-like Zn-dependent dehydrogenase
MRAITVAPGVGGTARVDELPDPLAGDDILLVDGIAIGVCGTDREIVDGSYGWAPPGRDRLILGHESLGRVRRAPAGSGFSAGDLVVGVVRRPDPVPCGACACGEFDMCRNGRYTERGIKQLDGYAAQAWTVEPAYAVRLDPGLADIGVLLEPTSVVIKAWEQIDRIGARSWFQPTRVLVTGAGPIGLLAALLGMQRGLDVHVLDRVGTGAKPSAVTAIGATYHHGEVADVAPGLRADVVVEATGSGAVAFEAIRHTAAYGITCLLGVPARGRTISVDVDAESREIVLDNDVVVGSVNANLRHYAAAADALTRAEPDWLRRLITRRVPLERFADALQPRSDDIKVVVDLT